MSIDEADGETVAGRPLLLVLGSGDRLYREYVLRSAARRYDLWLLQPEPISWESPYLVGGCTCNVVDPATAVDAARSIAEQSRVSGVLCYDEGLVVAAAHVAEALRLPGMGVGAVQACRDKHETRRRLAAAGVPQAGSICVTSAQEAWAAAERIGYPVVLKPRALFGSKGVLRVDSPGEMKAGYAAARSEWFEGYPVYDAGVLVEEYLDGPEISVDSVVFDGSCRPMVLARKKLGFDPYFEEVGHVVSAGDRLLEDPGLLRYLQDCHGTLGVRHGVTHTEIRLTSRGPRLVEINARLGGDLIPYLGSLATGVDTGMAAADVAAGVMPDITPRLSKVAAIRFLYPPQDCRVRSVVVAREGASPLIETAAAQALEGDTLRLPPRGYIARYGLVVAVADTEEECMAALADSESIVRLEAEPLGVGECVPWCCG